MSRRPLSSRLTRSLTGPEALESRWLPAVSFTGIPNVIPANRADIALTQIDSFRPIEPMVSVNSADPGNVVVSSHRGMRLSTNAATFTPPVLFQAPPGSNVFNGDTDHAFDADGRLYWVNMAGVGTAGISVSRINPTTGAAITSVRLSNNNDDKPFIVTDNSPTSPFRNNVYVVWTRFGVSPAQVFFSRSTNLGVTWSTPLQISDAAVEGFSWPPDVAVASNGDVYVSYHGQPNFNGIGDAGGNPTGMSGRTYVARSTNGGVSFPQKTQAFTAGQSDITFNVQNSPRTIPGTRFWTQGGAQPWVLPDPTRPGNVYVISADDPTNGTGAPYSRLYIARSTNNGTSWNAPVPIANQAGSSFQVFPTAAIDQFGNIVVAWYDNRRGLTNSAGRFLLDVFATYSTDGGVTWTPAFPINDLTNTFDPDPGATNRFAGPPPTTRIGEYFGIALYAGTAYVAWNGNTFAGSTPTGQQVWYSSFGIRGSLIVEGTSGPDIIEVSLVPGNTDFVQVLVNGQRQYAGLSSALANITLRGLGGNDIFVAREGAVPLIFEGGAGDNTLAGPNATNNWVISGTNSGRLSSPLLGPAAQFSSINNLYGGFQDDNYAFANGQILTGYIEDYGGFNSLDYSAYTSDVTVVLPLQVATGVNRGVVGIQSAIGGIGADVLVGNGLLNVFLGGAGRDVLIGGNGAAYLGGQQDDDILIGGSTAHDQNLFALDGIRNEWRRLDLTYDQRIMNLMVGGGLSPFLLNSSTVFGHTQENYLVGEGQFDWFFADLSLDVFDVVAGLERIQGI